MDKQKPEGLLSAAADFGVTVFDVRFRLAVVAQIWRLIYSCGGNLPIIGSIGRWLLYP